MFFPVCWFLMSVEKKSPYSGVFTEMSGGHFNCVVSFFAVMVAHCIVVRNDFMILLHLNYDMASTTFLSNFWKIYFYSLDELLSVLHISLCSASLFADISCTIIMFGVVCLYP